PSRPAYNTPPPPHTSTLSLHDALPICLPKGVTKEGLAAAKSGLDSLKSQWAEATSAATSGDYITAMAKAEGVKTKAAEMMRSLGDRKSTRLNSSHVSISYAVFCLKKKK